MVPAPARTSVAVALVAGLLGLAIPTSAHADPTAPSPRTLGSYLRLDDSGFTGTDGRAYPSAPRTVEGRRGELYFGPDFDLACGLGADVTRSWRRLALLARVIERSGRTVVWTVAPSKTTARPRLLPKDPPHGTCDTNGMVDVRRAVDAQRDRNFLALRRLLATDRRQVYFATDPHWTTVGGAVYAKALADRLDPRIGRLQRYEYGTETRDGLLNWFRGVFAPETAETARYAGRVRTRTTSSSEEQWSGYPALTSDYSWRSRPRRATIPGRTLLVGDSFTMFALDNLVPLFARGRFMWWDQSPEEDLVAAIARADTVVLESAEVFTPLGSLLTRSSFRRAVQRAVR